MKSSHDDVIKWKPFPRNWPFVREIHRSPVNCPHKGQWRGALMFSLIYAWINYWVNNREAGDLRRQHGHYDVIVMALYSFNISLFVPSGPTGNMTVLNKVQQVPKAGTGNYMSQNTVGCNYLSLLLITASSIQIHDDVIKWKHFSRYWPFVRGIQRSSVNSPHKGQWRGALMFSLICAE